MALKWNPVALSPQTPQIRGALRSISSVHCADVLTAMASITERKGEKKKKEDEKDIRTRERFTPAEFSIPIGENCYIFLHHRTWSVV